MNRRAEGAQGECHNWTVATQFFRLRDDFKISTLASGGGYLAAKALDAGEWRVLGRGLPLFDNMENLVNEAVKAQQTLELK